MIEGRNITVQSIMQTTEIISDIFCNSDVNTSGEIFYFCRSMNLWEEDRSGENEGAEVVFY